MMNVAETRPGKRIVLPSFFFCLFYVMCFNRKELLKNPRVVQVTWKPDCANLPCVTVLKMFLS